MHVVVDLGMVETPIEWVGAAPCLLSSGWYCIGLLLARTCCTQLLVTGSALPVCFGS